MGGEVMKQNYRTRGKNLPTEICNFRKQGGEKEKKKLPANIDRLYKKTATSHTAQIKLKAAETFGCNEMTPFWGIEGVVVCLRFNDT
jgi:hypothetical protein